MKNNFEQIIKNSLENHEVPYESGAWEKFNKAQSPTPFYKSKWFIGGAALIAIIASVTLYNLDFDSTNTQVAAINKEDIISESTNTVSTEKESLFIDTKNSPVESETELIHKEETLAVSDSDPKNTVDVAKEEGKSDLTKIKQEDQIIGDVKPITHIDEGKTNSPNLADEPKQIEPEKPLKLTPPSASFYIEKTICEGNEITLIADNANDNYEYAWKLNDGEIVSGKLISKEATLIGENKVTLFVSQDGIQLNKKNSTFTVIETPRDNAKIELNQASLINELEFDMDETSNKITWDFGDGTSSKESNPTHTYKKAGKYTCNYTITSQNGCSAKFERNINIKGYYNLRTDYGFSPGKRDNLNDVFIPVELAELNIPFEMSIYARSGQLLYTTISRDNPWDGRMKDGSTCPFGSYVWVVSLTNKLGAKEVYKGTVTNVSN